jgi:hypothetical protein
VLPLFNPIAATACAVLAVSGHLAAPAALPSMSMSQAAVGGCVCLLDGGLLPCKGLLGFGLAVCGVEPVLPSSDEAVWYPVVMALAVHVPEPLQEQLPGALVGAVQHLGHRLNKLLQLLVLHQRIYEHEKY